jgi:restriction endonuclease S subunit
MTAHKCDLCGKVFKLKTDYERHIARKNPCVSADEIIKKHVETTKSVKSNDEDINKIKKFFNFCHDLLRDKEGLVGMKALSNISMLLFLKFVNDSVKSGSIDLLEIEKHRKENGTCDEKFLKYKEYVKYCKFSNIIEDGKFKVEVCEIPTIIEFIFKHVLWHHPMTRDMYKDELPNIKYEITYEQILKKMDKVEWENIDVDVKGVAYELFLKSEMGGGDLGQFFTRREVVDYMIKTIRPHITKTAKFMDPFMGTGGFVTHMYNEIKSMYVKNKEPFTDALKLSLLNGIEKNPQTCVLSLNNCLLTTNVFPAGVKCDDSLRTYITEKYDIVLTNPPFGINGLTYDNTSMFPEKYHGVKKSDYIPHKSNDAICLAMQMIQYILNKNGIGAIVVPDGKQLTSEREKSLINVRKMLMENCDLFQVTKLGSGTFLPYTGVETAVLFFKKGTATKNVRFVKLENDYVTEKLIGVVDIDKIKKHSYSLNYKLYINENVVKYDDIEYLKFGNIFDVIKGKIQSTAMIDNDKEHCRFINKGDIDSWQRIEFSKCDTHGKNLFFGTSFNGNGKMPIRYYDGSCTYSNLVSHIKPKEKYSDMLNIKYWYYYFCSTNDLIEKTYGKGACNKSLDIHSINLWEIPVPPLPIQNLIVKELDALYKRKESLQTAIELYNVSMTAKFELLLRECKDKKDVPLEKICTFKSGKYNSSDKKTIGKYKFFNSEAQQPVGFSDQYCFDGKEYIIMIKDGGSGKGNYGDNIGLGKIFLIKNEKTCATSHQIAMFFNSDAKIEYFEKFFKFSKNALMDLAHYTTGLGCISMEKLKTFPITIPSKADQEHIIKEMEKYELLNTLQKEHIIELDNLIKQRFDYHLDQCKAKKDKTTKHESDDDSSTDEKPKKVKKATKKQVIKIDSDTESEGNKPQKKLKKKPIVDNSEDEKPKKKSDAKKKYESSDDSSTDDEAEKPKKVKKITTKKKSDAKKKYESSDDSSTDDEAEKPKKVKKITTKKK